MNIPEIDSDPLSSRRWTYRREKKSLVRIGIASGFSASFLLSLLLTYRPGPANEPISLLVPGLLLFILAMLTYFLAGSRRILLTSIVSYGHMLFVAVPAILVSLGRFELAPRLRISMMLVLLSAIMVVQVALFLVARTDIGYPGTKPKVNGSYQLIALVCAMISLCSSLLLGKTSLSSQIETLSLIAIILSSLVTFTRKSMGEAAPHATALMLITVQYAAFQFTGFGRLVLASYLLSIVVVMSWVTYTYWPKLAIIIVTAPALVVLSINRMAFIERTQGRKIGANEGIGSVFGPFQSGALIVQAAWDGRISPTHGESWLVSLLFWVPRSLWSQKPEGFGRAIVPITQPEQVSTTIFSDAAPYLAEFVWDFGLVGLWLGLVVVALVTVIDRIILTRVIDGDWTFREGGSVARFVMFAAISSMVLNYVWGGSFPFFSRTMTVAAGLFGIYWLVMNATRVSHTRARHRMISLGLDPGTRGTSSSDKHGSPVSVEAG